MDYERAREVCIEIAADMKRDADAFDGKPFNGRTVAEYFGNQGAAIAALAEIIAASLAEKGQPPAETTATLAFHAHLDVCRQCREHPFDLCPAGALLIRAAIAKAE